MTVEKDAAISALGSLKKLFRHYTDPVWTAFGNLQDEFRALPVAKDGQDGAPGKDGADGADGKDGDIGPDGKPGIDGAQGIQGERGLDGKDGADGLNGNQGAPGVDGRDGIDGAKGETGPDGQDGADGNDGEGIYEIAVKQGFVGDRATFLMSQKGADGHDGRDGRDGKPGLAGKDGEDGLGFDDMASFESDREFGFVFTRGDRVKEYKFKKASIGDVYLDVWKPGEYQKGDVVTWGGSLFLSQRDTNSKPETDDSWRLVVKRGREGKPGNDGKNARTPQPVRIGP